MGVPTCQARGGGRLPYERGGDARQKFWINPLKETNLDMAYPFFDPWERPFKTLITWIEEIKQIENE